MIRNPVLIIGCARSGTSLLYNLLAEIPDLWSIGYESKYIIEKYHHPSEKNWESGELDASDLTEKSRDYIISEFSNQAASGVFWGQMNLFRNILRRMRVSSYIKQFGKSTSPDTTQNNLLPQRIMELVRYYIKLRNILIPSLVPLNIQLLEKTPENCLRLPFLLEIFPDARIIYLVRDGRANVYSLMEGWRQPYLFPGYKIPATINIPGDIRGRWAFTLIPGWHELLDHPLEEVCAWQWVKCNLAIINFINEEAPCVPHMKVNYEHLIIDPTSVLDRIYKFIGVSERQSNRDVDLPNINVVSTPYHDKWHRKKDIIERVMPIIMPTMEILGYQ